MLDARHLPVTPKVDDLGRQMLCKATVALTAKADVPFPRWQDMREDHDTRKTNQMRHMGGGDKEGGKGDLWARKSHGDKADQGGVQRFTSS